MAMLRTAMVAVCAPAFPPCPATTGISAASSVKRASVSSKRLTMAAAAKAHSRLTSIHGSRRRTLVRTGLNTRSPSSSPTMRYMSSVASSASTSITSSAVVAPTSRPSPSTTGMASRL